MKQIYIDDSTFSSNDISKNKYKCRWSFIKKREDKRINRVDIIIVFISIIVISYFLKY